MLEEVQVQVLVWMFVGAWEGAYEGVLNGRGTMLERVLDWEDVHEGLWAKTVFFRQRKPL